MSEVSEAIDHQPLNGLSKEEEISVTLTKTEWFDVLEAIQQNNYLDLDENISNKIRAKLKSELGPEVDSDPWRNAES